MVEIGEGVGFFLVLVIGGRFLFVIIFFLGRVEPELFLDRSVVKVLFK